MTFSLQVTGACEVPLTIDWGVLDSLARGDDLVPDTAALSPKVRGEGVKLGAVLALARPLPTATHVMIHDDGEYRACLPIAEARAVAVLAHRLDGAPLPESSGGPARLLVPTSDNLCMSVKRVTRIELLTHAAPDTVPRPTTPLRKS
ncbi:MAG TPA: molybdopterin-dependent oxidoreductase [Polyangia bacterium]|jgi:DMSO/TMAO reductase YedYZ molybdopterin-dependent catalytic subunit|nr:molybdopterin-dependent oxidoreductase [Polyangia bacterium]